MTDCVVRCDDVTVRRGERTVLHAISVAVRAGETVTVIGPNGSGKTTLLLTMLGLLRPLRGDVWLNDRRMGSWSARARSRMMAYVPQSLERLPQTITREFVASGRYPHLTPLQPLRTSDWQRVDEALAACRLADHAEQPVATLSGGERQKALLAAAMVQDGQILCLDEPNTALDPGYQVELVHLLDEWRRKPGRGLFVISHDLQLPAVLGGRVVALHDGRLVADGPVEEVLEPDRLADIYGTGFEAVATTGGRRLIVPTWAPAALSSGGARG